MKESPRAACGARARAGSVLRAPDEGVDVRVGLPGSATQMYAKNIATFLKYLIKDGLVSLNREDEIVRETLVTHGGEVVHPRVRELMGLPALQPV